MNCPSCKNNPLVPTRLEQGLPAMGCSRCGGAFFSLLYYRDWIERHPLEEMESIEAKVESPGEDSHAALNCPKCGRIMTKFRITGGASNRLDLCASCDETWLDGGEWSLLKMLELSHQIPAVLTDAWQYKVRCEVSEDERKKRYLKILGEKDLQEAERIRRWLIEHPKRQDIINFISHE